jgi:pyruvate,water dikinase
MKSAAIDLENAIDVAKVGGKATWLGKLLRAGINVPGGFVIPTDIKFPLNQSTKTKILAKFDLLNTKKVAVRSSGINEDGQNQSFAGQFDTHLNVTKKDLITKITAVKNSTGDAQKYSGKKDLPVAVIIQKMLTPQVSGVTFSTNPITNNPDEIVIEAVSGLGEKLVSGVTTPDLFIIEKNTGEVLESENGATKTSLTKDQLDRLIEVTKHIENLADLPVDIEWAFENDQLFILQTRPITTLHKRGFSL